MSSAYRSPRSYVSYTKACDAAAAIFSSTCKAIEETQYATSEARDAAYDRAYAHRKSSYERAYTIVEAFQRREVK